MIYSRNVKIKIPKEQYIEIKQEANKKRRTVSYVLREKLGIQNPLRSTNGS